VHVKGLNGKSTKTTTPHSIAPFLSMLYVNTLRRRTHCILQTTIHGNISVSTNSFLLRFSSKFCIVSDNPSSKASLKPELGWCKYERQEAGQIHQNIDLFPIQMNATSFLTMDVDGLLDHFCKPRKSDSSTTWSTKEGYTHWCITPWTRHEKERVAAGIKKPAEGTKIGEFLDNAERGIIDMEVIESSDSIKAFLNSYLRWNGQTEIFGGSDMAGNEHGLEVGNSEDDVGEGGPALRGDIRKSSSVLSDDSSVGGGAPLG
jgi:hypothetical protein